MAAAEPEGIKLKQMKTDRDGKSETILKILRAANGTVSGTEISAKLGVSRAAVWKYVKELRTLGYDIEGVSNQGYSLLSAPDLLLPAEIKPYLPTDYKGDIFWAPALTSTNERAKELADKGAAKGTVVIAETQTGGHGRRGRAWQSPPGGIWFSIILRPDIALLLASRTSILAAVILAEEINNETGLAAAIKWPNDILINGKKVCGILIELSAQLEEVNYIIVGIGINANIEIDQLSADVRETAASLVYLLGKEVNRRRLLGKIAGRLSNESSSIFGAGYQDYLQRWRRLSAVLGRQVTITDGGRRVSGKAIDIMENGALKIELPGGDERVFESGDVSLRLK